MRFFDRASVNRHNSIRLQTNCTAERMHNAIVTAVVIVSADGVRWSYLGRGGEGTTGRGGMGLRPPYKGGPSPVPCSAPCSSHARPMLLPRASWPCFVA